MSRVRLLVGTRKGAFVLTSDGKRRQWKLDGPFFGGWEVYHVKGSPADPDRLYASQSTGWFGQLIQRSNDGGRTWEPVGNKFAPRVTFSACRRTYDANAGILSETYSEDTRKQFITSSGALEGSITQNEFEHDTRTYTWKLEAVAEPDESDAVAVLRN